MREIAHAEDMTKFNDAVEALKEHPIWNQNKALRDWFLGTWLKERKVLNTYVLLKSLSLFLLKHTRIQRNISSKSNNIFEISASFVAWFSA